MSRIAFDTLKYANRLENAGFTRDQAKAEADALADVLSTGTQELATKVDLLLVKNELKSDIQRVDYEIRLLKWMIGLSLAMSTGIIALLAKLFISLPS